MTDQPGQPAPPAESLGEAIVDVVDQALIDAADWVARFVTTSDEARRGPKPGRTICGPLDSPWVQEQQAIAAAEDAAWEAGR